MKLQSMTDFVLDHKHMILSNSDKYIHISNYAKFLKQALKLEMFIPCDKNGNAFEPCGCNGEDNCIDYYEYENAKVKVLFEGFILDEEDCLERKEPDGYIWKIDIDDLKKYIIEDMMNCDMTLTESAIKKLGL